MTGLGTDPQTKSAAYRAAFPFKIDGMSKPRIMEIKGSPELRRFLVFLNRNCTVDCCTSRAFEVNPEIIAQWRDSESESCHNKVYKELFELKKTDVHEFKFINLNLRDLESRWSVEEFFGFVDLLIGKLHQVLYQ